VGSLDMFGCGGDAGVVGLVELKEFASSWVVFGLELFNGGFAFVERSGSDEDVVGAFGHQLGGPFETDAAVCLGSVSEMVFCIDPRTSLTTGDQN
jgi:hypothetical protein